MSGSGEMEGRRKWFGIHRPGPAGKENVSIPISLFFSFRANPTQLLLPNPVI